MPNRKVLCDAASIAVPSIAAALLLSPGGESGARACAQTTLGGSTTALRMVGRTYGRTSVYYDGGGGLLSSLSACLARVRSSFSGRVNAAS